MNLKTALQLLETPFDLPTEKDGVVDDKAQSLSDLVKEKLGTDHIEADDYAGLTNAVVNFLLPYAEERPGPEYKYVQFDKTKGAHQPNSGSGQERSSVYLPIGSDAFSNEHTKVFKAAKMRAFKDSRLTVIKVAKNRGGAYSNWNDWNLYNNVLPKHLQKFFCPVFDSSKEILKGITEESDRRLFIQAVPAKITPQAKGRAVLKTFGIKMKYYIGGHNDSNFQSAWGLTKLHINNIRDIASRIEDTLGDGYIDLMTDPEAYEQEDSNMLRTFIKTKYKNLHDDDVRTIGNLMHDISSAVHNKRFAIPTRETLENCFLWFELQRYSGDLHGTNIGAIGDQIVIIDYAHNPNK